MDIIIPHHGKYCKVRYNVMLYLKRLKGNKLNVTSTYVDFSEFLSKMNSFATETVNIITDEITSLASSSRNISPSKRDGWYTLGDLAGGLLGTGASIAMRAQNMVLLEIPNDIITEIEKTPIISPYVPLGTIPIRITLLTGTSVIVLTEIMAMLPVAAGIGSIPGMNTPILPKSRGIREANEEIYLTDEQIMQSCIKVIHKINNLAKMTFGWDDYFWNNAEPIRNFITGETTIDEFLDTTRNAMSSLQELSKSNFPSEPNKYVNLLSLGIQAHKSNLALVSFMKSPTWHKTMKKLANGVFSI